jgi:hypothetical protein
MKRRHTGAGGGVSLFIGNLGGEISNASLSLSNAVAVGNSAAGSADTSKFVTCHCCHCRITVTGCGMLWRFLEQVWVVACLPPSAASTQVAALVAPFPPSHCPLPPLLQVAIRQMVVSVDFVGFPLCHFGWWVFDTEPRGACDLSRWRWSVNDHWWRCWWWRRF